MLLLSPERIISESGQDASIQIRSLHTDELHGIQSSIVPERVAIEHGSFWDRLVVITRDKLARTAKLAGVVAALSSIAYISTRTVEAPGVTTHFSSRNPASQITEESFVDPTSTLVFEAGAEAAIVIASGAVLGSLAIRDAANDANLRLIETSPIPAQYQHLH